MTRTALITLTALTTFALPAAASAQATCEPVPHNGDASARVLDVSDAFPAWSALLDHYDLPEHSAEAVFFDAADAALEFEAGAASLNVEDLYEALKVEGVHGADGFSKVIDFVETTAHQMRRGAQDAEAKADALQDAARGAVADYREVLGEMHRAQTKLAEIADAIDALRSGPATDRNDKKIDQLKRYEEKVRAELVRLTAERNAIRDEVAALHADRRGMTAMARQYEAGAAVFDALACTMNADLAADLAAEHDAPPAGTDSGPPYTK